MRKPDPIVSAFGKRTLKRTDCWRIVQLHLGQTGVRMLLLQPQRGLRSSWPERPRMPGHRREIRLPLLTSWLLPQRLPNSPKMIA